jgi:hypothetical protein
MSTAYSSKVLKVPVEYLAELCMLPSIAETAAELNHYGIACDGADVHFQRSSFDLQAKLVSTALLFFMLKMHWERRLKNEGMILCLQYKTPFLIGKYLLLAIVGGV